MPFEALAQAVAAAIQAAGIVAILLGSLVAVASCARGLRQGRSGNENYVHFRKGLGRSILLGLEFLVAADIIATVTISPTLRSVAVLGGIVLIRTFLSITMELEIEGRWPWQRNARLPKN